MLDLEESRYEVADLADMVGLPNEEVITILQGFDVYPRVYHSSDHILDLVRRIDKNNHTELTKRMLMTIALFHDYVYDPKAKYNERNSAEVFRHDYANRLLLTDGQINQIYDAIIDTAGHSSYSSIISKQFCFYDLAGFGDDNDSIIANEMKIRKEYAWVDWDDYVKGKLDFLSKYREVPIAQEDKTIQSGMDWIARYIKNEKAPNIGIYAGSFNPFHVGHKNILEKAEQIFDKVVVAYGWNPQKKGVYTELKPNTPIWSPNTYLKYHQVDVYDKSLVDYINSKSYNPTVIRGLRNTTDLQAELTQYRWLQSLKPDIKIVNIFCDAEYEHISSSAIRSVKEYYDLNELAEEYTIQ